MSLLTRLRVKEIGICAVMVLALLAVMLMAPTGQVRAASLPEQGAAAANFPMLDLGATTHGNAAVLALGADLDAVAKAYGTTSEELKKRLLGDDSLNVDRDGRLFYTCTGLSVKGQAEASEPVGSPIAPLADTFLLHSRPGSNRVIYLDFTGGVLTNTAWNASTGISSITCPPWDTDGNPSVFGDAERTAIQQIWQRVSEDYAPFDVDITTEEPPAASITRSSSSDNVYGTRALISPIASIVAPNAGGVAYVGIYNQVDTTDYYKPALIFPENLANGEKYIAEAVSHEVGHNVGLSHDGVTTTPGDNYYAGQGSSLVTGWAPIMGVGYYKPLTQWSKGEYANANNHEDDLVVIQQHGLSYRADDYGDSIAAASPLPSGTTSGVITTPADMDVFSFTAPAGLVTFALNAFERGPDLDIQADLLNADGTVLATNNPIGDINANISYTLPSAGTYYLRVQGVGEGDPLVTGYTDYGSLGQYTITSSVTGTGMTLNTSVASGSGSITRNPDLTSYTQGSTVQLTAVPTSGYTFTGWGGDASGSTNPLTVTMDANKSITATFTATTTTYTLGTSVASGSGSITKNPNQTSFSAGSTVQLTAVPTSGYTFIGWGGDASGSTNPLTVTMDSNKTITANFALPGAFTRFEQTNTFLAYAGSWTTGSSSSYSGGSFKYTNASGSSVTIKFTGTAVSYIARTGSTYGKAMVTLDGGTPIYVDLYSLNTVYKANVWTASSLGAGTHTLVIQWSGTRGSGTGYTVNFDAVDVLDGALVDANGGGTTYTLGTSVASGSGSITKNPNQTTFSAGDTVQLTAVPTSGYTFTGWGGDASGSTNPLTVTMDSNKTITATFTATTTTYTLGTSVASGSGSITKNPNQTTFSSGATVQLTAVPSSGYTFTGWGGDASGSTNPLTVTMDSNKTITATFTATTTTYTLSTSVASGSGSITKNPNQTTFSAGATVQLTAVPSSGYTFTGWGGDASGSTNPLTVTMDSNKTITATFAPTGSATRFEQTNTFFAYAGSWTTGNSSSYSGGSFIYTNSSTASVTIKFTGSAVSYIARTGPTYGKAKVTLDGGTPIYVDLYSLKTVYKANVWSLSGLGAGTHTLVIQWSGTRGSGTGYTINLDALDITGGSLVSG